MNSSILPPSAFIATDRSPRDLGVMPLIYHALESEHANVQEKVLGAIPSLCDNLDYSTLQDILLVKVAVSLQQRGGRR